MSIDTLTTDRSYTLDAAAAFHLSPNSIKPTSPKLPRDTCHREVSGKSATCHRGKVDDMDHVTGKSRGCFFRGFQTIAKCRGGLGKFPRQVGNKPVCVVKTAKWATSATRHGEVSGQINGDVTGLSRTSRV